MGFSFVLIQIENFGDRVSEDDMVKLGSLVSGVVERVTSHAIIVCVNAKGYSKGTISTEHLSDHHGICFVHLDKDWFSMQLCFATPVLILILCRAR